MNKPSARLTVSAILVAVAAAYACTDISDSSTAVLSIQFDTLPVPAVVLGDTLRDTVGAVVRPVVRAFNFKGDEISPAPIWFQSPDSGVTVDSATGVITADALLPSPARIIATVGTLQAIQRVDVTLRPDFIVAVNASDTLNYSLLDSTKNISPDLQVQLLHGIAPNDTAVKSYIVSFEIVSQSNPELGELVITSNKPSAIDTTDAGGIAGRRIRLHSVFLDSPTAVDSIVVNATARYKGVPVTGSPVRLVLHYKPLG
jgi:hypothetical protein